MPEGNQSKKMTLWSKILAVAALAALIFVLLALSEQLAKKKQIQREIEKLQSEAEKIGRENFSIQEKIAYLESRDYQEREAKDKLSLQSPGENVVVIKQEAVKDKKAGEEPPREVPPEPEKISNPLKWWNYFFKY